MMQIDEENDVPIFSGKMVGRNPIAAGALSEAPAIQANLG